MFCLIQFYIQLREDLAEHRPFMKVLCIKLVIFFSFWQTVCHLSFFKARDSLLMKDFVDTHQLPFLQQWTATPDQEDQLPRHQSWHPLSHAVH